MQYCRIIFLDNNNSVRFISSTEDNSTTNDSMVMKIARAQFHMYTNIIHKFQSSTYKTAGEKLRTKLCPRTDGRTEGQTAMAIPVYPPILRCGGYKYHHYKHSDQLSRALDIRCGLWCIQKPSSSLLIKKYIYYQIIWNNFKSLPHNNILAWCIFKARVDPDIFLRGGRGGMGGGVGLLH